jgi:transposase
MCPVLGPCRDWAVRHASSDAGIIGGLTQDQRRAAYRKLPRANGTAVPPAVIPEAVRQREAGLAAVRQAAFDDQRRQLTRPGPPPARRAYPGTAAAAASAPGPSAAISLAPTHARATAAAADAPGPAVVTSSAPDWLPAAVELAASGMSLRRIARQLGVSRGRTLSRDPAVLAARARALARQRDTSRQRRMAAVAGLAASGMSQRQITSELRMGRHQVRELQAAVARAGAASAGASASPPVVVAGTCTAAVTELVTGTSSVGEAGPVLVTVGLQAAS